MEARHDGRSLEMFFDTGANTTTVFPSFRDAMTKDEIAKLKKHREQTGGAGGVRSRAAELAPTLRLEVFGRSLELKNITLLPEQLAGSKSYRDGVLGMDALAGGFTLDFRNMQLRLD